MFFCLFVCFFFYPIFISAHDKLLYAIKRGWALCSLVLPYWARIRKELKVDNALEANVRSSKEAIEILVHSYYCGYPPLSNAKR